MYFRIFNAAGRQTPRPDGLHRLCIQVLNFTARLPRFSNMVWRLPSQLCLPDICRCLPAAVPLAIRPVQKYKAQWTLNMGMFSAHCTKDYFTVPSRKLWDSWAEAPMRSAVIMPPGGTSGPGAVMHSC